MKTLLISCALVISLSGCGTKLYSFRKTVKVKSTVASTQKYNGATRAYFTVEAQPATTEANASVNVTPNTLYLTTKPVPVAKKKKLSSASQPSSSAMVR
jgi:hypothetical protein